MPEKQLQDFQGVNNWFLNSIPFLVVIFLSCVGGMVGYFNRIDKQGIAFSFFRLSLEICTSGFVGIVVFLLCDIANLGWSVTAAFCAISGHMGTRALFLIEKPAIGVFLNLLKRNGLYENSETEIGREESATEDAKKSSKRQNSIKTKGSKKK